jgi:GntR family transcriptional regulator
MRAPNVIPSAGRSKFHRADGAPLYQELARWLEQKVRSGEYPKGSKIPGDTQLANELGVSVITVRAAMRTLRDKHLITRHAGKGTFVADEADGRVTWGLGSTEDLIALGFKTRIRLLSVAFVRPPEYVAAKFGYLKGKMFRCRTLRIHSGEPFVVTDVYLPEPIGSAIAKIDLRAALEKRRLVHVVVEETCGISTTDIRQTMGAEPAQDYAARILKVSKGTPLLTVERDYFTSDGTLVQVGRSSHRVDHYKYTINLKRVTHRM